MKTGFYPRLAWEGIRKNKRLYIPYIFTGCIMVMMYYILSFLSESPVLASMNSTGTMMAVVLPMGYFVITVFSVVFLFYTNSFLIRQRYRELGLYNILGMDKKNICRLIVWETSFVAVLAIIIGIILGIAMSKAAELLLLNLLHMEVSYTFSIGVKTLWQTPLIYAGIYLLLLVSSLIKVSRSKPLELMESSKVGERVPKRTWLLAAVGLVILTAAYWLAVSIKEPMTALFWFFVAVIMVIIATYLLMIAGSVVLCKLLQKNKGYYYKPNHFVSVSSMVYRMKRNGAGLASICILLTMVLVMISSTTCLYFGSEDTLERKCPGSVNLSTSFDDIRGIDDENLDKLRGILREYSGNEADLTGVRTAEIPGIITEDGIIIDFENASAAGIVPALNYDNLGYISVISLADYNRAAGQNKTLDDGECLLYCNRLNYQWENFTMEYGENLKVKERLETFPVDGEILGMSVPVVYMVVSDLEKFAVPVKDLKNSAGEPLMLYNWRCSFDLDTFAQSEKIMADEIDVAVMHLAGEDENGFYLHSFGTTSRQWQRYKFYDMYGSLLFLGIMLSVVFLMAAVLIIYYKQISEGYEDYARFDIMQKVGMTKGDIKRSINSQMLTVFFAPLLLAGLHLTFAFPFIMKIFKMFAFNDTMLAVTVNLICFGAFGLLYAVVYKITSGAYYNIVSGERGV